MGGGEVGEGVRVVGWMSMRMGGGGEDEDRKEECRRGGESEDRKGGEEWGGGGRWDWENGEEEWGMKRIGKMRKRGMTSERGKCGGTEVMRMGNGGAKDE